MRPAFCIFWVCRFVFLGKYCLVQYYCCHLMGKLMRGVSRVQSGQSKTGMEHLVFKKTCTKIWLSSKSCSKYEIRIYNNDNNTDTDNNNYNNRKINLLPRQRQHTQGNWEAGLQPSNFQAWFSCFFLSDQLIGVNLLRDQFGHFGDLFWLCCFHFGVVNGQFGQVLMLATTCPGCRCVCRAADSLSASFWTWESLGDFQNLLH